MDRDTREAVSAEMLPCHLVFCLASPWGKNDRLGYIPYHCRSHTLTGLQRRYLWLGRHVCMQTAQFTSLSPRRARQIRWNRGRSELLPPFIVTNRSDPRHREEKIDKKLILRNFLARLAFLSPFSLLSPHSSHCSHHLQYSSTNVCQKQRCL